METIKFTGENVIINNVTSTGKRFLLIDVGKETDLGIEIRSDISEVEVKNIFNEFMYLII